MKSIVVIISSFLLNYNISAQTDTSFQYKKNIKTLTIATSAAYVGTYSLFGIFWYSNQNQGNFHFFDDNDEWMQIDKLGHALGAFAISDNAIKTLQKTGMNPKKAIFVGGLTGLILQTPIEILDGFSENYGASWGDEIANASGSSLVISQYLLWNDIRIRPKFIYHTTLFPKNTPKKGILGNEWYDTWLKDYNGQTYWLSIDIYKFLGTENKFPKWLNLAFGTGATNMFRAEYNDNVALNSTPYRRYFCSLDINLLEIKTKSKVLKKIFTTVNYIRIPLPTIEFNSINGFKGHWLY